MPLQATSGAASYDAFGGGVPVVPAYIEEVFSTYLYTGTGATQTITNGIDLSTKGGMSWSKRRDAVGSHFIQDTVRGSTYYLQSDTANAQGGTTGVTFLTNGYSMSSGADMNISGRTNVSWTFRKQPKFFDVVTYTGNGANRTIAHLLDSVPGCIMVKRTDTAGDWQVYHRNLSNTEYMVLNSTAAVATGTTRWNSTTPTSTVFSVGTDATVNASGGTYVAYIFAHAAGGFGLTGTDNVISCGYFVTDVSGVASFNLGYEPQWLMFKRIDVAGYGWLMYDTMRGFVDGTSVSTADDKELRANTSAAETTQAGGIPNAIGFNAYTGLANASYIYIAIRRGPMKVPTDATKVFSPVARAGTGSATTVSGVGFAPDLVIGAARNNAAGKNPFDKLRGATNYLTTTGTAAEATDAASLTGFTNDGYTAGADGGSVNTINFVIPLVSWNFRRAPSFFDEVCYTGTGSAQNISHNLGVVPELIIVKSRNNVIDWVVKHSSFGVDDFIKLNTTAAKSFVSTMWNSVSPTASVFTVGSRPETNLSTYTYVAYLFATCAGVSKVFSYTGNGSSQTINCGFTSGARWILIKRTDSTGDWYVWDSARGIVSGNDPHLSLNTTAAEVTTDDSVDTDSTGFIVNQLSATNINVSSATYIGIAIA
jgi:hypothetical protein